MMRFIEGLPKYFSRKITTALNEECKHKIPWNEFTYGDLGSVIAKSTASKYCLLRPITYHRQSHGFKRICYGSK